MRKFTLVLAAVALFGWSGVANAQQPWSGMYFGFHGGFTSDGTATLTESLFGIPALSETDSYSVSGGLAGVQVGGLQQLNIGLGIPWRLVIGAELSVSGADISGSTNSCVVPGVTCSTDVNWMVTGLARAGLANQSFFVYGALGYTLAGADHRVAIGPFVLGQNSDVPHGLAWGLGVDVMIFGNLSAGLRYMHHDLTASDTGLLFGGVLTTGRRDVELDIVTLRLDWHF